MPKDKPLTYEELRQTRQAEWLAAQAVASKNLADFHALLAQMPDVKQAPSPDIPWSHEAIHCQGCAGKQFRVTRWVTCNGRRHRAELKCVECEKTATWDWSLMNWLPQEG